MNAQELLEIVGKMTEGKWFRPKFAGGFSIHSDAKPIIANRKGLLHGGVTVLEDAESLCVSKKQTASNLNGIIALRNEAPRIIEEQQILIAQMDQRIEFLEKALEQALSNGVAPCLPETVKTFDQWVADSPFVNPSDDRESLVFEYNIYVQRLNPYRENGVEFFHADECSYPHNCPELAAYLRGERP